MPNPQPIQPAEEAPKKKSAKTEEEIATEKLNAFLAENNIKIVPGLGFPNYNKLPVELELAVHIVQKHEPQFDIQVVIDKTETPAK